MPRDIRRAVVIGSGTMGGGLAVHLANVGVPVTLLDIVPDELTPEEADRGLTLKDEVVRNRVVNEGLGRTLKGRPAPLYTERALELITTGNLEDDFAAVGEADWVLEAIIEQMDIKRDLMARIDAVRKPGSVVSTNTSGLPIRAVAEGRSDDFRAHFLGTHFFNPPRYLKLLEVIPHEDTDPDVVAFMSRFGDEVLGKGVVLCKDTPNFIANRFASAAWAYEVAYALDNGYRFEEIDAIAGPLIGRPSTAVFRLLDLVGLDVMVKVNVNLVENLPGDEAIHWLEHEGATTLYDRMLDKGYLGNKAGQGFYKRTKVDGRTAFWVLDGETLEHRPPEKVGFKSVDAARKIEDYAERMRALVEADDRAADYIRAVTYFRLAYASNRIPEISDTLVAIDDAVRWGFAFEAGPFETWDMLGVAETLERMEAGGYEAAGWVREMLGNGCPTFYEYEDGLKVGCYDPPSGGYVPLEGDPKKLAVPQLRAANGVVASNDDASLVDMGDGVLLLAFHSKANMLTEKTVALGWEALARLDADFEALVVGNDGEHFSTGTSINSEQLQAPDAIERQLKDFQDLMMALRYAPKPVVTAPFGRTLAGGAEIAMAGARMVAAAELYMGQTEFGVGLVPAGGGVKEMLRRVVNPHMRVENADPLPVLQALFNQIGMAKVSGSAHEAGEMGFLTGADRIVVNRDHLLGQAKGEALHLVATGYRPPIPEKIYAAGHDVLAALEVQAFLMEDGGYVSEHDAHVARTLATVLTGGELSAPTWVDEQYILDLEREAFVSLVQEEKTVERIEHMLRTGKPLRN